MTISDKIEKFVKDIFKTTLEIFLDALKMSPNAQGYVSGSITELLLKKELEEKYGCEVIRIREKWEGKKHPNHHGDFYFRKNTDAPWFVLESKGLKSNSEKWHKLYNYENLIKFLFCNSDKISWISGKDDIEHQIKDWISKNIPKFESEYKNCLYDYEEIQKYLNNPPSRETKKSRAIDELASFNREQINQMINERLDYLMTKVRVLETHFVSGTSDSNQRTQATPRKDEFNIISIDIFLRYKEHKYLFANPKLLDSSGDNEEHLQQNYIMGFIFIDENDEGINISDDWHDNFDDVLLNIDKSDAVLESEMQPDFRLIIAED